MSALAVYEREGDTDDDIFRPKSSPLYRSLALDFRKNMDFGFMRGDESLVRSSARLTIGVDIPTEKDLPVLIVIPGRSEPTEGETATLEKGNFEAYTGALKYWKIKDWLDGIGSKVGADKSKAPVAPKKPARKKMTMKPIEEILPEGAAVEWKAQMPKDQGANMVKEAIERYEAAEAAAAEAPDAPIMDESKPQKDSFEGQKIDIEKAGEIADQIREEQTAASRKRKGQYVGMKKEEDLKIPSDLNAEAVKEEAGSLFDKAKAAVVSAKEKAAQAVKDASDSITESMEAGQQKVFNTANEASGGDLAALTGRPFEQKSRALMKQFEKWMSGEKAGWEEELGEQFEKAQVAAEELLKKSPEEARKQAWESEEWLLKEMKQDRERMMKVMTEEQKAQVESMIELIESRLKEKGTRDVFEKVLDTMTGENSSSSSSSSSAEAKKSHDEL